MQPKNTPAQTSIDRSADERLKLSQLENPETAIREAIEIGHKHEAGKGDNMACNCTFLEHQLDHIDLSKVPDYIQDSFTKIIKDLPKEEVEYLREKYWQE